MTDERMTELFWERSESALEEVQKHYAPSLYSLAMRLLNSPEDAEEIVNDTLLAAWNSIPPNRPESLKAYLSAVCRRRAMDRLDLLRREKRGGGEIPLALEELEETLPSGSDGRDWAGEISLRDSLERFADGLKPLERKVFLRRYWYMLSVEETAASCGISPGYAKVLLHRLRKKLKAQLEKEEQHG